MKKLFRKWLGITTLAQAQQSHLEVFSAVLKNQHDTNKFILNFISQIEQLKYADKNTKADTTTHRIKKFMEKHVKGRDKRSRETKSKKSNSTKLD